MQVLIFLKIYVIQIVANLLTGESLQMRAKIL